MLINEQNVNPVNIFYLNKEMFEFEDIQTAADLSDIINLFEEKYSPSGKLYIVIDEIQNISNWEKIDDNFPKFVVSMDDLLINSPKGIIHQQVWDYLYSL